MRTSCVQGHRGTPPSRHTAPSAPAARAPLSRGRAVAAPAACGLRLAAAAAAAAGGSAGQGLRGAQPPPAEPAAAVPRTAHSGRRAPCWASGQRCTQTPAPASDRMDVLEWHVNGDWQSDDARVRQRLVCMSGDRPGQRVRSLDPTDACVHRWVQEALPEV